MLVKRKGSRVLLLVNLAPVPYRLGVDENGVGVDGQLGLAWVGAWVHGVIMW